MYLSLETLRPVAVKSLCTESRVRVRVNEKLETAYCAMASFFKAISSSETSILLMMTMPSLAFSHSM